jgi:hypothetical protein
VVDDAVHQASAPYECERETVDVAASAGADESTVVRATTVLASALLVVLTLLTVASSAFADQVISTGGPLTELGISASLNCSVAHTGDGHGEFYGGSACGTFASIDGSGEVFGPADVPAGGSFSPWNPVDQSGVTGSGTSGDPYSITTTVAGGGLTLIETDAYVVGSESYTTSVVVRNDSGAELQGNLYRAGDCYLQDSDIGRGLVDAASDSVACQALVDAVDPTRVLMWTPLTPGSSYVEAGFRSVWTLVRGANTFPDSCDCATSEDNGAGLSWPYDLLPGAEATFVQRTTLSPSGGGIFSHPSLMIEFGDSFSSGEGARAGDGVSYDCGTNLHSDKYFQDTTVPHWGFWRTDVQAPQGPDCVPSTGSTTEPGNYGKRPLVGYKNLCHRTSYAYPNQIRAKLGIASADAAFVACSGATTQNIGAPGITGAKASYEDTSPHGVFGGKTQWSDAAQFLRDHHVDAKDFNGLITVSIGGNDAGLPSIVKDCMAPWHAHCENDGKQQNFLNKLDETVYPAVQTTFAALRSTYPHATIAAFGYVSVLSAANGTCGEMPNITQDEIDWLANTGEPAMNATIKDAALASGITYIDISDVTLGHEICSHPDDSSQEWANGVMGGSDIFGAVSNGSFHPNKLAHDAITKFFIDNYTDGHGTLTFVNPPNGSYTPINLGPVSPTATLDVQPACGPSCLQSDCTVGCTIQLQGSGYDPNESLTVQMGALGSGVFNGFRASVSAAFDSPASQFDAGTVQADANGDLDASVPIPLGLPAGMYVVELDDVGGSETAASASALFEVAQPDLSLAGATLSIVRSGDGSGEISTSDTALDCGDACDERIAQGSSVRLSAAPASGSVFAGWSGACAGVADATCTVTVKGDTAVGASFSKIQAKQAATAALRVSFAGKGRGSVLVGSQRCTTSCTQTLTVGAAVALRAMPARGSAFAGWSSPCSSRRSLTCQLTPQSDADVQARFRLLAPQLVHRPHVAGRASPGARLTCAHGTWRYASRYRIVWYRRGRLVHGAHQALTLRPSDVGGSVTCHVTAYGAGGSKSASARALRLTAQGGKTT